MGKLAEWYKAVCNNRLKPDLVYAKDLPWDDMAVVEKCAKTDLIVVCRDGTKYQRGKIVSRGTGQTFPNQKEE